jgi:hypothetical protein
MGNPGTLACVIMAVLDLVLLALVRFAELKPKVFAVESWMVYLVAGLGFVWLALAFGVTVRQVFAGYFAVGLTCLQLAASVAGLVLLVVWMAQYEFDPLSLVALLTMLVFSLLCLFLLVTGLPRLRRWWS